VVTIQLKPHSKLKKLQFDEDFAAIAIKGRGSIGNMATKYPVKKIVLKSKGVSTLAGRKIWYDDVLRRLNADGRGAYLGEFDGDDRILVVHKNGMYELTSFDLNNHFDDKMMLIEKYNPEKVFSVVHYEGKSKNYMVKRFLFENTAISKQTSIISEEGGSKLVILSGAAQPVVKIEQLKGKGLMPELAELNLADLIDVKGMKAMGNRLSAHTIQTIELIAEHDDAEDVPDPAPDSVEDTEPEMVEEKKPAPDVVPEKAIAPKPAFVSKPVIVEKPKTEPAEAVAPIVTAPKPKPEPEKPVKKVDFEITNPGDIKIDDKGQSSLF